MKEIEKRLAKLEGANSDGATYEDAIAVLSAERRGEVVSAEQWGRISESPLGKLLAKRPENH